MSFAFSDKIPIYLQIMNLVKQDVVVGKLVSGEKLLSVREMAEKYSVNPNTVQRVYQELERENIIFTQRGMGTFVTQDRSKIEEIKNGMAEELVVSFLRGMERLGFSGEETVEVLDKHIDMEGKHEQSIGDWKS